MAVGALEASEVLLRNTNEALQGLRAVKTAGAERESLRALLKQTYPHGKETIVEYSAALGQRMLLYEVDHTLSGSPQVGAEAGTPAAPVANAAP